MLKYDINYNLNVFARNRTSQLMKLGCFMPNANPMKHNIFIGTGIGIRNLANYKEIIPK